MRSAATKICRTVNLELESESVDRDNLLELLERIVAIASALAKVDECILGEMQKRNDSEEVVRVEVVGQASYQTLLSQTKAKIHAKIPPPPIQENQTFNNEEGGGTPLDGGDDNVSGSSLGCSVMSNLSPLFKLRLRREGIIDTFKNLWNQFIEELSASDNTPDEVKLKMLLGLLDSHEGRIHKLDEQIMNQLLVSESTSLPLVLDFERQEILRIQCVLGLMIGRIEEAKSKLAASIRNSEIATTPTSIPLNRKSEKEGELNV